MNDKEDPVVDLVRQAMASAIVSFLEDPYTWRAQMVEIERKNPGVGVHTAFTEEAKEFVRMRADLVAAIKK